ncbi:MAG: proprotein convertase P-domain-containing protein [Bacteroidota bacterium]
MRKHLHQVFMPNWYLNKNVLSPANGFVGNLLVVVFFCFSLIVGFGQSYDMDGTAITDCSGFFYDSGGSLGTYQSDESFTTTICSDATSGTHVQLIFSAVNIAQGDLLCFFDGPDASAPALSCHTDFTPGSPFIIQATAANTSGCLTVTFASDGSAEAEGWQADINCIPSCQTIIAELTSTMPAVVPPDTGYIDICPGDRVFFNGQGSYPQDGIVYNHSDLTSSFEWDFGDGTFGLGPNVSHTYDAPGGYIVQLTITDQFGCTNTNFISQRIRVSTNPAFSILGDVPDQLCAGDTVTLSAIVNQSDSAFVVGVTPVIGSFPTAGVRSDSLALPDGTGVAYETSIGFSNFTPGQVLSNVNDIERICVVMEHSWMRDLEISIQCPDGTSIILHDHPGTFGGEVFLGEPFEADESLPEPIPGVGYEYCWTPDATNGTWIEYANTTLGGTGTLPPGNYNSFNPMSNLLGCPLNGEWTIQVEDLWGIDNGFIFEWSIEFESSLYPDIETFTPEIVDFSWLDNPSIFFQTADSIVASPQNAGTASYTFQIQDDFGCTYDTSVLITILPPTHPDCFSCPEPQSTLQDTTICDGLPVQIDATNSGGLASQSITFESFPLYPLGFSNHPPTDPYAAPIEVTTINPLILTDPQTQICGVCLDLETDFAADIRIFLSAPTGEIMELSTGNGGAGDNYTNTCFSPTATTPITSGSAPFTGDFVPEGDWSDLTGATINGTWELLITDGFGVNDLGLFNSWSICFNTENNVVYEWSPVAGLSCYDCPDPVASPTVTSTYILEVSDDYGCGYADTITVNVLPNFTAPTNLDCDSLFNGGLSFSWDEIPGITNYLVNVNGGGWMPASDGSTHIVEGLSNGDIVTLEVQADVNNVNCAVEIASVTCTYFLCQIQAEIPPNGITPPSCANTNDGAVIVQAVGIGTGNYTFQLDDDPPQANGNFQSVSVGDHQVILTDIDGCADTVFFNIPASNLIVVDSIIATDVSCNGGNDGLAELMVSGGAGGFTYLWSDPLAQFSNPANSLSAGAYTVTVTDASMCTATASVEVNEPDVLTTSISPTDVNCFGDVDGVAMAMPTGGTMPYTYQWNTLPGQTTQTATSLPFGNYTVTVTDFNGCTIIETTNIQQPSSAVTASAVQTFVGCFGENGSVATVTAAGGTGQDYLYEWSNGNTSDLAENLSAQDYIVTVTDGNGCTAETALTVTELEEITINIIQSEPSCNGNSDGQLGVNIVTGGVGGGDLNNYTYSWNNNINTIANNNLAAGEYTITVSDAQGCSSQATAALVEPLAIAANADIQDPTCFEGADGQIALTVGGAQIATYEWDANANNQTTATATNLAFGNYLVTITDINDCSVISSFSVGQPSEIQVAFVTTESDCFGEEEGTISTTLTGGLPNYTFAWTNNDTTENFSSNEVNLDDLVASLYTVTITDANGCVVVDSVQVESPPPLWADLQSDSVTCFGDQDGALFVDGQGGTAPYQYSFAGGDYSAASTFLGLEVGSYPINVRDRNGCEAFFDVFVGGPEPIVVDLGEDINIDLGQPANIASTVTPSDNYFYTWSPTDSLNCTDCPNTVAIGLLFPTTYRLVVENEFGCKGEDFVTVFINKDRRVFVPTGFSPDRNGNNDLLRTHGREGTIVNNFRVYSRWGELVYQNVVPFEINAEDVGWDGTFDGKEMNPGVYIWYLEVEYIDGATESFKGHSTLLR